MKTLWLFALLLSLSLVAYIQIVGVPSEAAQSPGRPGAMPEPAAVEGSGNLPAGYSEYAFLHQTRLESIPVHAMTGVKTCPE